MRFYIASSFSNIDMVRRVAAVLKAAGHEQSVDWTVIEHYEGTDQAQLAEHAMKIAHDELRAVETAQTVIVLLPGGKGTHTELGLALAYDKPVVICSEEPGPFEVKDGAVPFYWHGRVQHSIGTMDTWLMDILDRMRRVSFGGY